jgi:pimeloyl-ACP methyl ester carboxylesterase
VTCGMREADALRTSHGLIWVEQSGHGELPVLLIHGNSSCLDVFRCQIDSPLASQYRLIAFDLPGHGRSCDAIDPARTYTLPGFADVACEILTLLAVEEAVVLGWSLGGHIALEMMHGFFRAKGLVLVGTPPVGPDTFSKGFRPSPHFELAAGAEWSDADVERFGHAVFDEAFSPDLKTALIRAHGIARRTLFEARRAGVGGDQRKLVESLTMPIAVLNGAEDPFINLDYLDSISFKNLWRGQCHRIVGAAHAPFLQKPAEFNEILKEYLAGLANDRQRAIR